MELSFSASGWLMGYQLGVARAFQMHNVHTKEYVRRFVGSSGGAAVSAALAIDTDIEALVEFFLKCHKDYEQQPHRNMFRMRQYMEECILRVADANTYKHESLQNQRCLISVTLLPSCKNLLISEFNSTKELMDTILASCTMSPLAGLPFKIEKPGDLDLHGSWVFDGGLSAMIPKTTENAVTVTPFSPWDADIKPSTRIPMWYAIFPPSQEEMVNLYTLGIKDGDRWIRENVQRFTKSLRVHRPLGEPCCPRIVINNGNNGAIVVPAGPVLSSRKQLVRACVKSIAFTVAYMELYAKSCLSVSHALISAAEMKRRAKIKPRNGPLSIRKWIPDLGSPKDSLCTTVECLDTMVSMSVFLGKLAGLGPSPVAKDIVGDSEGQQAKRQSLRERLTSHKVKLEKQLTERSYFYSFFSLA